MDEEVSALVIELAEDLMSFCDSVQHNPPWDKAFYRSRYGKQSIGANGCYTIGSKVEFLGPHRVPNFSERMFKNSKKLFTLLEKKKGLYLLSVDANSGYSIKFDFENTSRWKITKEDGASGLPVDD